MASAETISQCLVILGAAYPRTRVPRQTASVYAQLLADVDDNLLVAAVKHHAASSKWFPTVAELREAALELQDRADGVPSVEDAWGEVCEKMRLYPPVPLETGWRVPEFSHPLILKAVNVLGGWVQLGESENGIADRAHFFRIYPELVARRRSDVALLPSVRETIRQLARQRSLPGGTESLTTPVGDAGPDGTRVLKVAHGLKPDARTDSSEPGTSLRATRPVSRATEPVSRTTDGDFGETGRVEPQVGDKFGTSPGEEDRG